MPYQNTALCCRTGRAFRGVCCPSTPPGAGQVVVRARALTVNPVDGRPGADAARLGRSTSVGSNAIQLARNAGYRVVATASPHNFDHVPSLGAAVAVDYHSLTAVDEIGDRVGTSTLAKDKQVGPAIYTGFLPAALAAGAYRAAPDASIVGDGLARIPAALQRLRGGISATKLVVTV